MFLEYTGIGLSVRLSICVQNTNFCQSAGGGIKSHLVVVLAYSNSALLSVNLLLFFYV